MSDADLIEELRSIATAIRGTEPAIERAADAIERMNSQIDSLIDDLVDARRKVCELESRMCGAHPRHIAERRGWFVYGEQEGYR